MASIKFNPFTNKFDYVGSGGGSSYIDGDVEYHSNLPVTVGTPAVNSAFLVRKGEGLYFISRKPAGIWVRELNNGNLDDWKYAGTFSDLYRDANFRILNDADVTKELAFDVSGITTGTTRTLTAPDASGTIVLSGAATTSGLTQAADRILGRTTASTGAIEEISATSPLALDSGALKIDSGAAGAGAALEADGSGGVSFVAPRTVVYTKTADTGRTSTTTYADDDHLAGWSLDADSNYRIEFFLPFTSTSNGGLRALFYAPSYTPTSARNGVFVRENISVVAVATVSATQLFLANVAVASTASNWAGSAYFRTGATGGTGALRWGQSTSSVDTTTLKEGAFVSITKMS